ncbi:hypothetical protein [Halosimplex halobium]|uniref:hypothetical protein n=1 Tax=Halosimplex halobium TaxID=3396618 RepID=UPI003F54DB4D
MASVPVDERTKARIRELCEEIERETGRAVSERAVVERMVEREFASREALVDSFREGASDPVDDDFEGLSEAEIERFFAGTSDWGIDTAEDEIDEVLYGDEALSEFDDE